MKILVSSINFWPDHSGIALYSTDLPVYIAEQKSHEVTMVTGFSYYPKWQKQPQDKGRFFAKEIYKNVRLLRGYLYVPKRVSTLHRIIHELSFIFFATLNFIRAGRQDCIIVLSPPLLLGLVGILFKYLWGARLVFHIQDLQPDAAISLGMVKKGLMIRTLLFIEKLIYKHSDHVATITEGMRKRLVQKGVPAEKLGLYYNWIDVAEASTPRVSGNFRAKHPKFQGKFLVAYAGNIGIKQGVDVLVDLAEKMKADDRIHFVIAGDGADKERLKKIGEERKLTNLTFLPFLAPAEYFDLLEDIELSFIAQRAGTGDVFFPSKLLGIMAMSKAVLISADNESELSTFVRRHEFGYTAPAGDLEQLSAAVQRVCDEPALLKELGAKARKAVEAFDRKVVLGELLKWVETADWHPATAPLTSRTS